MDWYWWVLIILGVGIIGYLKLYFFKKMKEKSQNKPNYKEEDE
ncbi:MAG: hypothetical protein PHP32_06065 [Candidatus Izemoplasmatales bacterium]|nr:hypothetical protein [Candidatus Izemoplasmatales bacterium]